MDEMKIQSGFMKSLISNFIKGKLSKKIGHKCDVTIHKLGFVNDGEKTTINISVDLEAQTADIPRILEQLGIM